MNILTSQQTDNLCLCGSKHTYTQCCEPFHLKETYPETAQQLMRSRFTAFELHLTDYILETWDKSTRPGRLDFTPGFHWKKLSINGCKKGRKKDREGWVTFMAYFNHQNEQGYLHEKSYFKRDSDNHWCYVDGEIKDS